MQWCGVGREREHSMSVFRSSKYPRWHGSARIMRLVWDFWWLLVFFDYFARLTFLTAIVDAVQAWIYIQTVCKIRFLLLIYLCTYIWSEMLVGTLSGLGSWGCAHLWHGDTEQPELPDSRAGDLSLSVKSHWKLGCGLKMITKLHKSECYRRSQTSLESLWIWVAHTNNYCQCRSCAGPCLGFGTQQH